MRTGLPKLALRRGITLVETMVAIGVLAIVAPLALAALLKSGEGGASARAETRAPAIVEACLAELKVAREGLSEHLPALQAGESFGTDGVLCLAFNRQGALLGKVDAATYDAGTTRVANQDAVFFARLRGELETERDGFSPMLTVAVTVEHPAVAPGNKRRRMEFHTKLP